MGIICIIEGIIKIIKNYEKIRGLQKRRFGTRVLR
jgi:hypothetical protein